MSEGMGIYDHGWVMSLPLCILCSSSFLSKFVEER